MIHGSIASRPFSPRARACQCLGHDVTNGVFNLQVREPWAHQAAPGIFWICAANAASNFRSSVARYQSSTPAIRGAFKTPDFQRLDRRGMTRMSLKAFAPFRFGIAREAKRGAAPEVASPHNALPPARPLRKSGSGPHSGSMPSTSLKCMPRIPPRNLSSSSSTYHSFNIPANMFGAPPTAVLPEPPSPSL